MTTGVLSKDVELRVGSGSGSSITYTAIPGLVEFPDLGAAPDMVDITTLADGNYMYIPGIKDYGSLDFTFIYDGNGATSNFATVKDLEGSIQNWEIEIPGLESGDEITFHFSGEPSVYMTGAGVNARLEFVISIALNSDIVEA